MRTSKQLFLDDYCVEETRGVRRVLHQPRKCGPVLRPDPSLGEIWVQSRNVPQWNPEKRLWEWWYWVGHAVPPHGQYQSTSTVLVHYAVSADGVHWDKPSLGLYEWKGSKDNNIAIDPQRGDRGLYHAIRDENDPDPTRRYKGMFAAKGSGRKPVVSPDAFTWTELDVPEIPSSDESHFFYDEWGKQYVALVKHATVWGRSVFLITSTDFKEWKSHGIVMHADDTDWDNRSKRIRAIVQDPRYLSPPILDEEDYIAEVYCMAVLQYEGIYIGLVNLFNPAGAIPPPHMNYTGINQVELAMSRNLLNWRRLCNRELFLALEPWDGVAYDTQQVLACGSPIIRDNEIRVYYNACRFRGHKELYDEKYHPYFGDISALNLAKLRLDGFVSLFAADEGVVLTKPLALSGGNLYVNVDASEGELRAEIVDARSMKPLAGLSLDESVTIAGDRLHARLAWRESTPASVASKGPVRIRFVLRSAHFYAFWEAADEGG